MSAKSKRRKKQSIAKGTVAETKLEPTAEDVIPTAAEIPAYDGEFADVEDFAVGQADERQLLLLMKDWRKGRATQSIWDALTNGYATVFSILVIGAMFVGGVMEAQKSAAGCTSTGCITAKTLVPWLSIAAMALLALGLAKLFGPVVASAAEGFWLLDAPIRRARLLRGRLWQVIALAFAVATLIAGLIAALVGASWQSALLWGIAAGLAAAAATAFAAAQQGADRSTPVSIAQGIVGLATVVILVLVVAVSARWVEFPVDLALNTQIAYLVAGLALVILVVSAWLARTRLNDFRRARLVSGGDLMSGLQGAAFALDFGLMRDILIERKFLSKGHVKPTRGKGVAGSALIWRDIQRLARNPLNVVILLLSAIVPYASESLGMGVFGELVSAIVLMFVLVPFFDSLRVLTRTKGLARMFPFSQGQLRSAAMMIPAMLALVWAWLTTPAYVIGSVVQESTPGSVLSTALVSLVIGAAGYLGAIRWVSAKSADYSSPMVATGAGAMPPSLIFNLFRGFDVIAVVMIPMVFGLSPWISVVLALIVWSFLRSGGIDTQELMEQNAEAQKELAAARAASKGGSTPAREKTVIKRSEMKR